MNFISKEFVIKVLFFAGVFIILTSILTTYLEKQQIDLKNSSSFSSIMLELELASTKSELLNVLGSSTSVHGEKERKAVNLQNFYNTYLYFSYSVFILLIFLFFYKINTHFS
ncbi:MAG: hypothetical protein ACRENO_02800, partial [Thermodesulfobacteriota bacterium]